MGPFFFTLVFHILFPTIDVGLVYEKEVNLRIIMKMMGLGTGAYWIINYAFWVLALSHAGVTASTSCCSSSSSSIQFRLQCFVPPSSAPCASHKYSHFE